MQLKLNRYTSSATIKENQNGLTLKELTFKVNETLSCLSVSKFSASKFPLLNDDMTDLNARSMHIFCQMFEKYSIVDPD